MMAVNPIKRTTIRRTTLKSCYALGLPRCKARELIWKFSKFATPDGLIREEKLGKVVDILKKEAPGESDKIMDILRRNGLVSPTINSSVSTISDEITRQQKNFMRNLLKSKEIDEVMHVIPQSIINMGIARGVGVYEVNSAAEELHARERIELPGESRAKEWRKWREELGYVNYIVKMIGECIASSKGTEQLGYINLSKKIRFALLKRNKWPEYGLNREICRKALDACGLNKLKAGMDDGDITKEMADELIKAMNERLYLTDELIDGFGGKIYQKYIENLRSRSLKDREKIEKEKKKLEEAYKTFIRKIKDIAKDSIVWLFNNEDRREFSKIVCKQKTIDQLYILINHSDCLHRFRKIACYYSEALNDLEMEKERFNIEEKGDSERLIDNFYYVITDQNYMPIATVLANNHMKSIEEKRNIPLFHGEEMSKFSNALLEISDVTAISIEEKILKRESQRDRTQALLLSKLSEIMSNASLLLEEKLKRAVFIMKNIFRRNGEKIEVSIMKVNPGNTDEMEIVAATKIDKKTNMPIEYKVSMKKDEKPKEISAWVYQTKKGLLIINGKIYRTKNLLEGDVATYDDLDLNIRKNKVILLTDNELDEIRNSSPDIYDKLDEIAKDRSNSFMSAPLIPDGVINVSGAKLDEKDMALLMSCKDAVSQAIQSHKQEEALKILATTDSRTGFFNLAYFDEKMEKEFKQAKDLNLPLSLITMDLINFRDYNNKADHSTGNYALTSFAENVRRFNLAVSRSKEDKDPGAMLKDMTIARLGGGDEFGILMPHTSITKALQYIRKFENFTRENPVRFEKGPFSGQSRVIFFRAGVAAYNDSSSGNLKFVIQSINDLYCAADKAERTAKEQGGDPIRQAQ